jgi:glycine cleavage system H protein
MTGAVYCGAVPDGLLYDTLYDMWVRRDGDIVTMGATSFGLHLAGEIIAFTPKPRGAEVARGRGLGTVECSKTVLAVHAPVSIVGLEGNEDAEERPALLNHDPYANWMVRGRPTAWAIEVADLVDAMTYRRHVLAMEPEAIVV